MGIFFNKAILKTFMALILITAIMFTAVYLVFSNSMNELYLQAVENNKLLVADTIRSFDEYFKEINNIIYTLYVLPDNTNDPFSGPDVDLYNSYLLTQKLRQLISSKDYIDDIVLFCDSSPLAVTSKGTINLKTLIDRKYKNDKYSPEYWMSFAKTRHPLKIMPVSDYIETEENSSNLFTKKLVCIIGSNQYFKNNLNILAFLNVDNLLKSVKLLNGASLIVMDESMNILMDSMGKDNLNDIGEIYFDKGLEKVIKKNGYEYYCMRSDYNGYTYIYKAPLDISKFSAVLKTNQILLIISIFLGIALSIILSLFLYKPVKRILKLLNDDLNGKTKEDNYVHIYNSIQNMRKEKDSLHLQIDSSEYDIQRSVFFKMLDDINYYKDLKEQIDKYFKVIFNSRKFLLAEFMAENMTNRPECSEGNLSAEDMAVVFQDALNNRFASAMVFQTSNSQFLALVGLRDNIKRDATIKDMQAVISELENSVLSGYSVIVAASREYMSPQDCKAAYKDIRMCFAYRNIKSSKSVIDVERLDFSQEVYFPEALAEKLSSCISYGNISEGVRIINQIIDKNVENDISYIKFSDLIKTIFNLIIAHILVQMENKENIALLERLFYEKLERISHYEDMRVFLIETIIRADEKHVKSKSNRLNKEMISQYINLHYFENLYLDNIAEQFDTSPKYFSNYFKKAFNINFVDYLNKLRISHAKEFLSNTNLLVCEIKDKVGYANSSTFASTFRKYCGVSPNEYRAFCKNKVAK